jgi:hypothetical protein
VSGVDAAAAYAVDTRRRTTVVRIRVLGESGVTLRGRSGVARTKKH